MDHPSLLSTIHHDSDSNTEELIAAAIAGVVNSAHAQGQSLADVTRLVLEDDSELDWVTRKWLSEIVAEAWEDLFHSEDLFDSEDLFGSTTLEAA